MAGEIDKDVGTALLHGPPEPARLRVALTAEHLAEFAECGVLEHEDIAVAETERAAEKITHCFGIAVSEVNRHGLPIALVADHNSDRIRIVFEQPDILGERRQHKPW